MRRTRLGKVVGSYRAPLDGWTYWQEREWASGEDGFMVVAPSGARMVWVATEEQARALVAEANRNDRLERRYGRCFGEDGDGRV